MHGNAQRSFLLDDGLHSDVTRLTISRCNVSDQKDAHNSGEVSQHSFAQSWLHLVSDQSRKNALAPFTKKFSEIFHNFKTLHDAQNGAKAN